VGAEKSQILILGARVLRQSIESNKNIMARHANRQGLLIAVIGDEDTVTGLLLGGIGNVDPKKNNFLIVKGDETEKRVIEKAFEDFTKRPDIGIVVINQHIANEIRYLLDEYTQLFPTVMEIPSKEHPYNPENDFIMNKVARLMGANK